MKELEKLGELLKRLKISLQLLNCYSNKSAINTLVLNNLKIDNNYASDQICEEKKKILDLIQEIDEGNLEAAQKILSDKNNLLYQISFTPHHKIENILSDYLNWEIERQLLTLLLEIENSITIYNLNRNLVSLNEIKNNFRKVKALLSTNQKFSTIGWSNYKRVRKLLNSYIPGCQQKSYHRQPSSIRTKLK